MLRVSAEWAGRDQCCCAFLPPPLLLLVAVWCADLDVGDACDGEHAADEEARQDVVVVQVLAQPHLDLQQVSASRLSIPVYEAAGSSDGATAPRSHLDEVILGCAGPLLRPCWRRHSCPAGIHGSREGNSCCCPVTAASKPKETSQLAWAFLLSCRDLIYCHLPNDALC